MPEHLSRLLHHALADCDQEFALVEDHAQLGPIYATEHFVLMRRDYHFFRRVDLN